ncbi:MAG: cofactor-independent phosphoglycerate mutase [Firmicutes bacterium HGW-Firmicutes-15]|nr:MAG: cofactor-independent phosphoglycerate mutase [Firmicutes bacterium HGW-Firmicutes-15]
MKYLLVLTDGMADYKIDKLGNKTPLQFSQTPNMDNLAASSLIGQVKTVPLNFPPGSDVANLSVMGYDPRQYYTGRSPLEAVSMGVELGAGDLALRCNLVTLSEEKDYRDKTMQDYSSGEITSAESAQLIEAVKNELGSDIFNFHAGISYRHLLVWKDGIDKTLVLTPPHDISDRKILDYLPAGSDGSLLLNIMVKSEAILKNHPINQARMEKGLNPATSLWFWGEGSKPALNSFNDKYQLQGSVVSAVDLVKGLGICAGLTPIKVNGATGGIITNFAGKARAALDELKRGQDFVYLHIESPDEAGHQGELKKKIWAIEQIDREVIGLVISELKDFDDIRVLVLPDHPTPLSLRTHTSDPVPFMLFDKNNPLDSGIIKYDEETALQGRFFDNGYELMDYFILGK